MQQHGSFIEAQCCCTSNEDNNLNQRNKIIKQICRQTWEEYSAPDGWCDETETYFFSSQRKNTEQHGRVMKSRKMLLRQIRHLIGSLLQSQTAFIWVQCYFKTTW